MLDIHSHQITPNTIYNLLIQDIRQFVRLENQWLSVGIHPWYIQDWQTQLIEIEAIANNKNVLAIGECGLDRLIKIPINEQVPIFEAQVQLAEQLNKPVVIHCVKAHNDLIAWKKQRKTTVPLIVHGFNNNRQILDQLLKNGFDISLGTALLNANSNASKSIRHIPINRLFLETDDSITPIEIVYQVAAQRLNCEIDILQKQISDNFADKFLVHSSMNYQ
jgi:TatD DNase family protein